MKLNEYIQKLCCFYVSDWHLTVMLLPYINSKIEENSSIYMRCENNIENNMKILLEKLKIKNKSKIMNLNWNNNRLAEETEDPKDKIYIVSGTRAYIKNTNELIQQYYKGKDTNVKIINCYEISKDNNFNDIVEENGYKRMVNTKGECDISVMTK